MAFEDLKVRISAATASFNAKMGRAQDSIDDVRDSSLSAAGGLQTLQNRADEAEDEVGSLGRSAATTSTLLATLHSGALSVTGTLGTMTVVTGTLTASLITLSSVLAPLAATFATVAAGAAGLVGVFGAIIGSGLIAFGQKRGEQNQKRLEEVRARIRELEQLRQKSGELTRAQRKQLRQLERQEKKLEGQTGVMGGLASAMSNVVDQIRPLIVQFGQRFIPLIEDAIAAIPALVENIISAIGPTEQFVQALRAFGQEAFEVIPQVVSAFFDLAEVALPVLVDLVNYLQEKIPVAAREMRRATAATADTFLSFAQSVIAFLPVFLEFGIVAANTLVPAFERLVDGLTATLQYVNQLSPQLRKLTASASALAPAVGLIAIKLAAINPVLGLIAGGVGLLYAAWRTNFMGIQQVAESVINTITGLFTQFQSAVIEPFVSGFESAFNDRIQTVLSETQETFALLVEAINSVLPGASETVSTFTNRITEFGEVAGETANVAQTLAIALNNIAQGDRSVGNIFGDVDIVGKFSKLSEILSGFDFAGSLEGMFGRDLAQSLREFDYWLGQLGRAFGFFARQTMRNAPQINHFFSVLTSQFSQTLVTLGRQMKPLVEELAVTWLQLSSALMQIATGALVVFSAAWGRFGDEILRVINPLIGAVGAFSRAIITSLSNLGQLVLNLIQGDFGEAWTNLKTVVMAPMQAVANFLLGKTEGGGAPALLKGAFDTLAETLRVIGEGVFEWLLPAGKQALTDVVLWLMGSGESGGAPALLQSAVDWLFSNGIDITWDILGAIGKAFTDAANWIVNQGVKLLTSALQVVSKKLGETFSVAGPGRGPYQLQGGEITSQSLEGSVTPRLAQGVRVNGEVREIQVSGTLTTENGEIVAKIDERVEKNSRQGRNRVANKTGESPRSTR